MNPQLTARLFADEIGEMVMIRKTRPAKQARDIGSKILDAVRSLLAGEELSAITDGSVSLIDIVRAALSVVGVARVDIATWTMGIYDAMECEQFVMDRRISKLRMLVDPSMFGRRPELSAKLVQGFGVDSFRAVNIHAKFAVLQGEHGTMTIRSSMNLNPNRRIEALDVSTDAGMAKFYAGFVDHVWDKVPAGNESQAESLFDRLFRGDGVPVETSAKVIRSPTLRSAVKRWG